MRSNARSILRLMIAVGGVIACLWAMHISYRSGMSRILSFYASQAVKLKEAERAVALRPSDPEAYNARSLALVNLGRLDEAIADLERAVALRPEDYFLWLQLGRARDMANDEAGALAALKESVRLAPFYAEPRWQMGNVLYRMGRREEGLAEIRRAARSDTTYWPLFIDLAWGTYQHDAQAVERSVQPETKNESLMLARFFIKHGEVERALALFRALSDLMDEDRRAFLGDLLKAKRYGEACEVWTQMKSINGDKRECRTGAVTNGGFEHRINLLEEGFDWQQSSDVKGVRVLLDRDDVREGVQSLLLEFDGNAQSALPALSQLVLVEPDTRYEMSFAARTSNLVTGGLPVITIVESGVERQLLAQSTPLPQGTSGWHDYHVQWKTSKTARAVAINLQRQSCSSGPCPAFGRIWLDNLIIRKL